MLNIFEEIVNSRYSCRDFDPHREVPKSILRRVLRATQRSPSAFNLQPWVAVVVSENAQRERLYCAALKQRQVLNAPICVVFACSTNAYSDAQKLVRENHSSLNGTQKFYFHRNTGYMLDKGPLGAFKTVKSVGGEIFRHVTGKPMLSMPKSMHAYGWKQVMIPVTHFLLAATAAGLQSACLEGFDERDIRKVTGLPNDFSVPCVVSVGYASSPATGAPSRRKDPNMVFYDGVYGKSSELF